MISNVPARAWSRGAGIAALFCLGLAVPAAAEAPEDADLRLIDDRLVAIEGMQDLMRTCPAEIWRTRLTWLNSMLAKLKDWRVSQCEDDLSACVDSCLVSQNGTACFAVARLFEINDAPEFKMASRRAFALACALGEPSGCTNRSAGLKNAPIPSDDLSQNMSEEMEICLYRSFATACDADDAWGCAMEGQALHLGEGTPPDAHRARLRLQRACALSPLPEKRETEFAPCRFARTQLEWLDEAD
ncbi:MAG: hypothetical protein ACK5MQ_10700 [Pikeienuella sp.]